MRKAKARPLQFLAAAFSLTNCVGFLPPVTFARCVRYAEVQRGAISKHLASLRRVRVLAAAEGRQEDDVRIREAKEAAQAEDSEWYLQFIAESDADIEVSEPPEPSPAPFFTPERVPRPRSSGAKDTFIREESDERNAVSNYSRPSPARDKQERRESEEWVSGSASSVEIAAAAAVMAAEPDVVIPARSVVTPAQLGPLIALGYSEEEANELVPDMVDLIIEKRVKRPSSGPIPAEWTSVVIPIPTPRPLVDGEPRRRSTRSSTRAKDDSRGSARDRRETLDRDGTYRLRPRQEDRTRRQSERDPRSRRPAERARRRDDEQEETALGNWPSLGAFKEMLRKETEFRLDAVGPSITDALATENKMRLQAYEGFLAWIQDSTGDDAILKRHEEKERFEERSRPTKYGRAPASTRRVSDAPEEPDFIEVMKEGISKFTSFLGLDGDNERGDGWDTPRDSRREYNRGGGDRPPRRRSTRQSTAWEERGRRYQSRTDAKSNESGADYDRASRYDEEF